LITPKAIVLAYWHTAQFFSSYDPNVASKGFIHSTTLEPKFMCAERGVGLGHLPELDCKQRRKVKYSLLDITFLL
jgi:hypothetical protein